MISYLNNPIGIITKNKINKRQIINTPKCRQFFFFVQFFTHTHILSKKKIHTRLKFSVKNLIAEKSQKHKTFHIFFVSKIETINYLLFYDKLLINWNCIFMDILYYFLTTKNTHQ